jgi:RNA polymerase sigma-70 factor (ECF subfamily)
MDRRREKQIIRSVLRGRRERFALLVDEYREPVFNLAYRMCGNRADAEDMSQNTFLRAYENLWRYDSRRPFFTWLYTLALNVIRSHIKAAAVQARRRQNRPDPGAAAPAADSEAALIQSQEALRLAEQVAKLPRALREAIVLRYYLELPFGSVAAVAGISPGAARMRAHRALLRLNQQMDPSRQKSGAPQSFANHRSGVAAGDPDPPEDDYAPATR